jgi:hypothetical protein
LLAQRRDVPSDAGMDPATSGARSLLRHALATLAYRAAKVLRDVPPGYAECRPIAGGRSPLEIVSHLGDVMEWAATMAVGPVKWTVGGGTMWVSEVTRFFAAIERLDAWFASDRPLARPAEVIFQGPIADALTHVGQLAMLRRAAGAPIRPESYAKADIAAGRVGAQQQPPKAEFDGDASARR